LTLRVKSLETFLVDKGLVVADADSAIAELGYVGQSSEHMVVAIL